MLGQVEAEPECRLPRTISRTARMRSRISFQPDKLRTKLAKRRHDAEEWLQYFISAVPTSARVTGTRWHAALTMSAPT